MKPFQFLFISFLVAFSPWIVAVQSIAGDVSARGTGEPIASALVQLIARDSTVLASAFTDESGRFTFSLDGCGPSEGFLYVARVGYRSLRAAIRDLAQDCSAWSVTLEIDPVGLPPVTVRAPRNRALENVGFYNRQRLGIGTFITRDILEDRYRTLSRVDDILQQVPGVMRVEQAHDSWAVYFDRSITATMKPCAAVGYIDGLFFGRQIPRLGTHDIEAIEIYRGSAQVPAQYDGNDALCGVVLIWTRTGAGR